MAEKNKFGSKIGLVAATVGSAIGLGNVWRFPAEAQQGGGAAFLLVYVLCVFLLGIPVMLAEFSLGRGAGTDAVGAYRKFAPRSPWWVAGALPVLASYIILSFYMVVAGWTLEYFLQSVSGALYRGVDVATPDAALDGIFAARMQEYICGTSGPLLNTYALIAINLGVLLMGVRKGIERISNVLMPLLFVLLLVFCSVSLSLPGAAEGLKYFLAPDFSKITPAEVVAALGQAFFSLSLGMGILITYAAYYPKRTRLVRTAVTVSLLDMMAAVLMGFIIFPAVASFGLDGAEMEGTALVFVTLPEVFARMPATQLWSSMFFFLLLVAALTSTISIAEVSVSFVQNRFRRSRRSACMIVLVPLFLLSALSALSFGMLDWVRIGGLGIFDFLDTAATNFMLPVASILLCLFMGWRKPGILRGELCNYGSDDSRLRGPVLFIIRWVAPLLILAVLATSVL